MCFWYNESVFLLLSRDRRVKGNAQETKYQTLKKLNYKIIKKKEEEEKERKKKHGEKSKRGKKEKVKLLWMSKPEVPSIFFDYFDHFLYLLPSRKEY